MTVIKRLQRLTGEEVERKQDDGDHHGRRDEVLGDLRRRVEAIMARRPGDAAVRERPLPESSEGGRDIADVIPGAVMTNDRGSCFVVDDVLEGSVRHGRRAIADMRFPDMNHLALLARDDRLGGMDPAGALFLDTETTGLAGGTGTTAFLIGLGWFEGTCLMTRQIFLRDFSDEAAALALLREILRERSFLITFNGKAFDVGLLATRFIMNRQEDPFGGFPHLDLLFPSRRLLGHRLENCRLGTLEEQVLAVRRSGDIPGFEIPERYFAWLRRRDGRLMADVFEHNRIDVVSMAALAVHLAELIDADSRDHREIQEDLLAAARLRLSRGDEQGGRRMLEFLLSDVTADDAGPAFLEALKELSLLHKRREQWSEARELWEGILHRRPGDSFALLELAKWCEHRARDFERALELTDRALAQAGEEGSLLREALLNRRNRLCRKCGLVREEPS